MDELRAAAAAQAAMFQLGDDPAFPELTHSSAKDPAE
jgi:hypothetical protein